jgi:hypothetical protein
MITRIKQFSGSFSRNEKHYSYIVSTLIPGTDREVQLKLPDGTYVEKTYDANMLFRIVLEDLIKEYC